MNERNVLIIPPDIPPEDIKDISLEDMPELIYCGDIYFQKAPVREFFGHVPCVIGLQDIGGDGIFRDAEQEVMKFARQWFEQGPVSELFDFDGVNMAGCLIIAYTFYFMKAVKAVDTCNELLSRYKDDIIVLVDDGDIWAEIFKNAALGKGKEIKRFRAGRSRDPIWQEFMPQEDKTLRKMLSYLADKFRQPIGTGGTVYSCALRYAKPLWNIDDLSGDIYFIRPLMSMDAFRQSRLETRMEHFSTGSFSPLGSPGESADSQINESSFDIIDRYFSGSDYFDYKGLHLWDMVREGLFRMLDSSKGTLFRYAMFVRRFFRLYKPALVIVEEDTCPFNYFLVKYARERGVRTLQILHGLLTNELMSGKLNADVITVYGEYGRRKLISWGLSEKRIEVIGAPHYRGICKKPSASEIIEAGGRYRVVLFTSPFFSESKPYFIKNPLTPFNSEKMLRVICTLIDSSDNVEAVIKTHHMDSSVDMTRNYMDKNCRKGRWQMITEGHSTELIETSDAVLCGGSTVYLESLLMRKPVFVLDDPKEPYWNDLRAVSLDLNVPEDCVKKIVEVLSPGEKRKNKIEAQEKELEWHFLDKNESAEHEFKKILRSTSGAVF